MKKKKIIVVTDPKKTIKEINTNKLEADDTVGEVDLRNDKRLGDNLNREDDAQDEGLTSSEQYSNAAIRTYGADVSFKTIMIGIEDGIYEIPKFQRFYKWDTDQAEELAASLVRGMPIPPIYAYRSETGILRILDGQQRMISLYLYYKGKRKKSLRTLVDFRDREIKDVVEDKTKFIDHVYNMHFYKDSEDSNLVQQDVDISYDGLPEATKRIVDYRTINIVEIQLDNVQYRRNNLFKIFANLNSGGSPLTAQELRNGLYGSDFYNMLFELNSNNQKWQHGYGEPSKDSKDIELLLRFCAMLARTEFDAKTGYFKIRKFSRYITMLNDFSEEVTSYNAEKITAYKNYLEIFIDNYGIGYKDSIALCESAFVVTTLFPELSNKMSYSRLNKIRNIRDYSATISGGTANMAKIEQRMKVIYDELSNDD